MRRSAQQGLRLALCLWVMPALADRPAPAQSGRAFQSPATQALQDDDAQNPGMLWVETGTRLFMQTDAPNGKACASCHAASEEPFKSAATRFPLVDATANALINLEGQINRCRTGRQSAPVFAHESNDLLSLTAYLSHLARGLPRRPVIDGAAAPFFAAGRQFWQSRQGQMNLACSQCHDDNVGRKLRGDTISQGQSHGWPGYRLEWQSMGSLHRRLRACSLGVRAEILDYGAPEYLALELYLAWRGETLPLEGPGVRR